MFAILNLPRLGACLRMSVIACMFDLTHSVPVSAEVMSWLGQFTSSTDAMVISLMLEERNMTTLSDLAGLADEDGTTTDLADGILDMKEKRIGRKVQKLFEKHISSLKLGPKPRLDMNSFISRLIEMGTYTWSDFANTMKANRLHAMPEEKQCKALVDVSKSCSCFEMLNMADKWLEAVEHGAELERLEGRVSARDYKARYRRASRLHHPDHGGSEEAQTFLNACVEALCGSHKCSKFVLESWRAERKKTYIESLSMAWNQCPQMSSNVEAIIKCVQTSTASANRELLKPKPATARDDAKRTHRAQPADDEEIVVFLDNTKSFREGSRLHDAKIWLKGLWPEFERTRTSFHLIGGSQASVAANEFKDRVEAAGGQYEATAIRATLIWNGGHECVDLDLHVTEPGGETISYAHRRSSVSEGFLDVDAGHVGKLCDDVRGPVENIRWLPGSRPMQGTYKVQVHLYSHRTLPVQLISYKVEVQVEGMDNRVFDGRVSRDDSSMIPIMEFDYISGGVGGNRVSDEIFESSTVPNITYLDVHWQGTAWTTYLWKYAYDVLLQKGTQGMKKWRAVFFVDGYDNDSPGAFGGPTGYNEMMNQLYRNQVRPEINIICFGSEECERAKNAQQTNPWLALALSTGGRFEFVPEDLPEKNLLASLNAFYDIFADSVVKRIGHRRSAKTQWLELTMSDPLSVANANQEYTKSLQMHSSASDVFDEEATRTLQDLSSQQYRGDL